MTPWVRIVSIVTVVFGCVFPLLTEPPKILKIALLAEHKGTVWSYREAAQTEPHPNALRIMSMVADYGLPISLSTKPDYSNVVDGKGRSSPRH
jgi:hypothetical protein